jgi:WD40 repeat protein
MKTHMGLLAALVLVANAHAVSALHPYLTLASTDRLSLIGFSPDSRTLLTKRKGKPVLVAYGKGSPWYLVKYSGPIELWETSTGRRRAAFLSQLKGSFWYEDMNLCRDLAPSPDGRLLPVRCEDGLLKVMDVEAGQVRATIRIKEKDPDSKEEAPDSGARYDTTPRYEFSPDGKFLAFSKSTGTKSSVGLWEVSTNRVRWTHPEAGWPLAFSPDGRSVADCIINSPEGQPTVGREVSRVRVWSVTTGKLERTLPATKSQIEDLQFSPDSASLVTAESNEHSIVLADLQRQARLWDLRTGRERATLVGASDCFKFLPDGRTLATGWLAPEDKNRGVKWWDWRTGKALRFVRTGPESTLEMLAGGRLIAIWRTENEKRDTYSLRIADLAAEKPLLRFADCDEYAFSPAGKVIAIEDSEGRIRLYDLPPRRDQEIPKRP